MNDRPRRVSVAIVGIGCRFPLLLHPANLLLLDKPTNHLDLDSKSILLEALAAYKGPIVFVSHDRYFLDELTTKVAEVGGEVSIDSFERQPTESPRASRPSRAPRQAESRDSSNPSRLSGDRGRVSRAWTPLGRAPPADLDETAPDENSRRRSSLHPRAQCARGSGPVFPVQAPRSLRPRRAVDAEPIHFVLQHRNDESGHDALTGAGVR